MPAFSMVDHIENGCSQFETGQTHVHTYTTIVLVLAC